jgi:hypothetical protein
MFEIIQILINSALARADVLLNLSLLIFATFSMRLLLIKMGQLWISSFSSALSFYLLPIITYSITSVISGNIALSLGLVGALSIVRFRNPVKSSLELTLYFLLIGLGITASADFRWTFVLITSVLIILSATYVCSKIMSRFFNKTLFIASFNEGNAMSVLEIHSNKRIQSLENSELLIGLVSDSTGVIYRLASSNKLELKNLLDIFGDDKNVRSIQLQAV